MKKSLVIIGILVSLLVFHGYAVADSEETVTPEEVVKMVHEAADFLSEKGEEGLEAFNDPDGRWVLNDAYVFVYRCDEGIIAAHPIKPKLIGKKMRGLKDVKGNLFFVQLCEAAQRSGGDWVEYWWPKPDEKEPARKISYMMGVPNTPYQVGAGIYDETLSIETLRTSK